MWKGTTSKIKPRSRIGSSVMMPYGDQVVGESVQAQAGGGAEISRQILQRETRHSISAW